MDESQRVCLETNKAAGPRQRRSHRKLYLKFGIVVADCLRHGLRGPSFELKNGSLIKGKFTGGTEVGLASVDSSVQEYKVADIVALRFDSEKLPDMPTRPTGSFNDGSGCQREDSRFSRSQQ